MQQGRHDPGAGLLPLCKVQEQYEQLHHVLYYIREETLKLPTAYEAEQKELTPTIVNKFAKKIIVHALDKSSGRRPQKI